MGGTSRHLSVHTIDGERGEAGGGFGCKRLKDRRGPDARPPMSQRSCSAASFLSTCIPFLANALGSKSAAALEGGRRAVKTAAGSKLYFH